MQSVRLDEALAGRNGERMSIRISLLGGFHVERSGEHVPDTAWQRSSAKDLVKMLAAEPAHCLHREQILEHLWPDLTPQSAEIALRKALHYARHTLEPQLSPRGGSSYLVLRDDLVLLCGQLIWIDADYFESLAAAAHKGKEISAFEAAISSYGGALLPEDRYAEWAIARREFLSALFLRLLLGMADILEERGAYDLAAEWLQRALNQDPIQEEVHRRLMRFYMLIGSRHRAMRQYQACRDALNRELNDEPEQETKKLYQELLAVKRSASEPEQHRLLGAYPMPPALRQIASTQFIGRERALDLLLSNLGNAAEGQGRAVLVGGEAGVGKTRLAAELARRQYDRGALVLWGASHEHEGSFPYGTFVEALESYTANLSWQQREDLTRSYPEVTHLLPSLSRFALVSAERSGELKRRQLFAAVVRLLADVSEHTPLLLVLDDLHLADLETLQLFHHLIRLAVRRSWTIMATYREGGVIRGSKFQRLLIDASRQGICDRIELLRLARHECDDLVQSLLGGEGVERALLSQIYTYSLGNPLFAQELVSTMRDAGEIVLGGGGWELTKARQMTVPRRVQDLVAVRVDGMGDQVGKTLALASVAGNEFSFADLRGAAHRVHHDLTDGVLLDCLDRALDIQMLEERGECYVFRHPLFLAALYDRLSHGRRAQLHRAYAEAIEEHRPLEVETLAHHYVRSGNLEKAASYLEQAGDRARLSYANGAAEARYREAIDQWEMAGRKLDAARCRQKMGAVLTTVACYDAALQSLEEAASAYQKAEDLTELAGVIARIGQVHMYRGTAPEGIARIQPVLKKVEEEGVSGQAGLYGALAPLFWLGGWYRELLRAADRAIELAGSANDDPVAPAAHMWRGIALQNLGEVSQSFSALKKAICLAEQTDDVFILAATLYNTGNHYANLGMFQKSMNDLERALELSERQGDPALTAHVLHLLGEVMINFGNWNQARAYLAQAEERSCEAGQSAASPGPQLGLGRLCLYEGDWDTASWHARESIRRAQVTGIAMGMSEGKILEAEITLTQGKFDQGRSLLQALLDREDVPPVMTPRILWLLGWAELELGNGVRAEERATQSIDELTATHMVLGQPQALLVKARALNRQCRYAEAEQTLEQSIHLAHTMPLPYVEAQGLRDLGIIRHHTGEPIPARAQISDALGIFRALGAQKQTERTEQVLAGIKDQ